MLSRKILPSGNLNSRYWYPAVGPKVQAPACTTPFTSLNGVSAGAVPPCGVVRVKSASATGRLDPSLNVHVTTGPGMVLPTTPAAGWLGAVETVATLGRVTRAETLSRPVAEKV